MTKISEVVTFKMQSTCQIKNSACFTYSQPPTKDGFMEILLEVGWGFKGCGNPGTL